MTFGHHKTIHWHRWRQLAVRLVKRSIEWLLYGVFDSLALMGKPSSPVARQVAIVYVEQLGDAFLWLPYGQALVRHLQDRGFIVTLVVDRITQPILYTVFPDCHLLPISRQELIRKPLARWRLLRALRHCHAEETFHPWDPRAAIVQDAVVRALGAPAWGFDSVHVDRPWLDRRVSRRLYRHWLTPMPAVHQNHRQRQFLRALGVDLTSIRPADLPTMDEPPLDEPFWIVAPGASRTFRQWPVERFATVAQHLLEIRPGWRCVVIGTAEEKTLAQPIIRKGGAAVIDLTGQTSVLQMLHWIAHARLILGNDSAAGHIAAAYGTPAVVVVGGGHWGRCYPYDPREAPVRCLPVAVGHRMSCFGCDWICEHTSRMDAPFPCISHVTVESVLASLQALLDDLP